MKILIAYDGSEASKHALTQGLNIAKAMNAHVVLLTVVGLLPTPGVSAIEGQVIQWSEGFRAEMDEKLEKLGRTVIEQGLKMARGLGVPCQAYVDLGAPRRQICYWAQKEHVDLIVLGSRGLGTLEGMLLGSVSRYVVQHASCSVLVAKPTAPPEKRAPERESQENLDAIPHDFTPQV